MKKSEAVTLHSKEANWKKFPVFVWEENGELVTEVDGKVFKAQTAFGLDSKLDDEAIPRPRNLYFVDEPDYEQAA